MTSQPATAPQNLASARTYPAANCNRALRAALPPHRGVRKVLDSAAELSALRQTQFGVPRAVLRDSTAFEATAMLSQELCTAAATPVAGTSVRGEVLKGDESPRAPLDLPEELLPRHVAVIMDGNSRWAVSRGLQVRYGHEAGVRALRRTVRCCLAWQIPALTVFAFSAENWRRTKEEVGLLMALFQDVVFSELRMLIKESVRLRFIGDRSRLHPSMQHLMKRVEEETEAGHALQLTVALSYGGRQDMVRAVQQIGHEIAKGRLQPSQVDEGVIADCLGLSHLPKHLQQPDLLIRSSGERRLSNFLLWELAYSELYFTDTRWPDFGEADLRAALSDFCARQRRYGRH